MRAHELGIAAGHLARGPLNAITDVPGVLVGQVTRVVGDNVRTGATVVLPHAGNVYQERVPAGFAVANGYGKFVGSTQVVELGEIETPIALTNTLSAPQAADALIHWTLQQPGNEGVTSVNPIVGETNDGVLNDIRQRFLTREDFIEALAIASDGAVDEGAVGAGTGTITFGWKGGIGTSSRALPAHLGGFRVGVLVQSNYGGSLRIDGRPVASPAESLQADGSIFPTADGSIVIVVATDAPLSDRNLTRLARRSFAGLARTGSAFSNGSGDYAIAFSTSPNVRRTALRRAQLSTMEELPNDLMSPLFQAASDATEEAIYNSMLRAVATTSANQILGRSVTVEGLDAEAVRSTLATSA